MPLDMVRQSGLKEPLPPLLVNFAVTRRCNLRCKHCYAESTDSAHPDELTTSEAMRLITDIADLGGRLVVFDGGEPLLRDDIYQLVGHTSQSGLLPALNTNGTLLGTEAAIRLKEAGLQLLTVGLKGHDATSHNEFCGVDGSWDRATTGAANGPEAGIRSRLSTCITRESGTHVMEFAMLAKRLKAEGVEFYRFLPVGRGKQYANMALKQDDEAQVVNQIIGQPVEDLRYSCVAIPQLWVAAFRRNGKKALDTFEKSACVAGLYRCSVTHDGSVLPCEFLRKKVGNIRQAAFKDIWQQSEVLSKLRDRNKLEKKCGKCSHQEDCSGARCIVFHETGSLTKSNGCFWFDKHDPSNRRNVAGVIGCSECGEEAVTTCVVCHSALCAKHSLTCPICHAPFCSPSSRSCIFSHNCEASQ